MATCSPYRAAVVGCRALRTKWRSAGPMLSARPSMPLWQRGRIGEAAIKPRLQLVLADLLPWLAADFSDRLLTPQPLRAGLTWGANLDQAAVAAARVRPLSAQARLNELEQTTRELRSR